MIREKYPDLDRSNMDLTEMKGYDKPDLTDGSDRQKDQGVEKGVVVIAYQTRVEENQKEGNITDAHPNPFSLIFESNIPSSHIEDPLNVPSDPNN